MELSHGGRVIEIDFELEAKREETNREFFSAVSLDEPGKVRSEWWVRCPQISKVLGSNDDIRRVSGGCSSEVRFLGDFLFRDPVLVPRWSSNHD